MECLRGVAVVVYILSQVTTPFGKDILSILEAMVSINYSEVPKVWDTTFEEGGQSFYRLLHNMDTIVEIVNNYTSDSKN